MHRSVLGSATNDKAIGMVKLCWPRHGELGQVGEGQEGAVQERGRVGGR